MVLQASNPAAAFNPYGLGVSLPGGNARMSSPRQARISTTLNQDEALLDGKRVVKKMPDGKQIWADDPAVPKTQRVGPCLMADSTKSGFRKPISKDEILQTLSKMKTVMKNKLFNRKPKRRSGPVDYEIKTSGKTRKISRKAKNKLKDLWKNPGAFPDMWSNPNSALRKSWRLLGCLNPLRNCYTMFRPTLASMSSNPAFLGILTHPLVVNENLNFLWFYNIGILYFATYIQRNKSLPGFMQLTRDGRFYLLLDVMMSMFSIALALPVQSVPYVIQKGIIGQAYVAMALLVAHLVALVAARGIITGKKHDDDWGLSHLDQSARIHSTAAGSVL